MLFWVINISRPTDDTIAEFNFVIDDATKLFHDLEAFGVVRNARSIIEKVIQHDVEQSSHDREIKIGAYPEIVLLYWKERDFFCRYSIRKDFGLPQSDHSLFRRARGRKNNE